MGAPIDCGGGAGRGALCCPGLLKLPSMANGSSERPALLLWVAGGALTGAALKDAKGSPLL